MGKELMTMKHQSSWKWKTMMLSKYTKNKQVVATEEIKSIQFSISFKVKVTIVKKWTSLSVYIYVCLKKICNLVFLRNILMCYSTFL
ncbi:uncharacterized protein LOC143426082 isoform X2 [Xylocopa sonorina]|uniref:uncharacterized protein LOC143426082 isoform X2 n=1 Tax=Xylocopa sonorina TaxID=1818115 RepID=UPI00403A8AC9